jgi:hypothetical protein
MSVKWMVDNRHPLFFFRHCYERLTKIAGFT